MRLFKVASGYAPLLNKAYNVIITHPEILSTVFDKKEFIRDYLLLKNLTLISNEISELKEIINKTLMAINSDTLNGAWISKPKMDKPPPTSLNVKLYKNITKNSLTEKEFKLISGIILFVRISPETIRPYCSGTGNKVHPTPIKNRECLQVNPKCLRVIRVCL